MQIILPLIISLFAYYFSKQIRLNSTIIYLIAIIVSSLPLMDLHNQYYQIIQTGLLGLSFYIVVMYTGALKKGSNIKKKLRNVRKEFAILGTIFIIPHALLSINYALFDAVPIEWAGLLAVLLIVPLSLSSFNLFKQTIKTSQWIKLHQLAYIVYALLFIHLIIVSFDSTVLYYISIFSGYLFLKLKNYVFSSLNILKSTLITVSVISGSSFALLTFTSISDATFDILDGNEFEDGTYIAEGKGYRNMDTILSLTVNDNHISNIELISCGCATSIDEGFYLDAAYLQVVNITKNNRTDIDAISGATITSRSINEAVVNALKQAKK